MKKLLLFTSALFILNIASYGQAITNGGFETWNSSSYEEPNNWYTGNRNTFSRMGVSPVTKVAGQSGYALRIETIALNGDTSDSYISNSAAGDPSEGVGGVPFSQQATALTGFYRYNLPGNDSAGILVVFKKNGVIISMDIFKFKGTGSQPTFAAFSFPLSLSSVPDTVIIAAVASNLLTGQGIENGSYLELDGLGFAGASQTIPNGIFENWTTVPYETPAGWSAMGDSVYKTPQQYAGAYAIAMKTTPSPDGQINPSGITNGRQEKNGILGGQPFTLMADTLVGYYKYTSPGTDTASGFISLSRNGSPVGGGGFNLQPAASYTYFQVPVSAFQAPDTMLVVFISSSYNTPVTGSTLLLDGLALKSVLTGMDEKADFVPTLLTYPNPVSDILNMELNHRTASALITIYDISGRPVQESVKIISGNSKLNVSDLPKGIYTVEIKYGQELLRSRFVKN